jgi:hypothetical protein
MKKHVLSTVLTTLIAATVVAGQGRGPQGSFDENPGREGAYAVGMWGDLPYSDLQATVGVPNMIADMNQQNLAFTVHNGDLKAGSGTPGSATPSSARPSPSASIVSVRKFKPMRRSAWVWAVPCRASKTGGGRSAG